MREVGAYELPRTPEPGADAGGAASDAGASIRDAGIDEPDDGDPGAASARDAEGDAPPGAEDDDDSEAKGDASAGDGEPGARRSSGCALSPRAPHAHGGAWLLALIGSLATWCARRRAA